MLMKRLSLSLCALALTLAAASAQAATLFFDFGDAQQQTAGNYNNVTPAQLPLFNTVDSTGASTGIALTTSGFNPGPNGNGPNPPLGAAAIFDVQATRDNLFGHTQVFGTTPPFPQAVLTLSGLDGSGATQYDFTFFAGRLGLGASPDNRETSYQVVGANSSTVLLNAANNSSNTVTAAGITPTPAGGIVVNLTTGPNNTNGTGFFYLGAMRIVSNPIPEPSALAASLTGFAAIAVRRKRRSRLG